MRFKKSYIRAYENDPPAGTTAPPPAPPAAEKTFKQVDVDKIVQERIAAERAKFTKEQAALLERAKALETDAAKKAELEQQILDLQNQNLTKEQLAEKEHKKQLSLLEGKLKELESKTTQWQEKYTNEKIVRDITDAAAAKDADAYNPTQIVDLLRPRSVMKEKFDKDTGKGTGVFETRIKLSTVDKDGKPVELDLTPPEAMKVMKEDAERFGNLFKANVSGGLGSGSPRQNGKGRDMKTMSQDEINKLYREGGIDALLP